MAGPKWTGDQYVRTFPNLCLPLLDAVGKEIEAISMGLLTMVKIEFQAFSLLGLVHP